MNGISARPAISKCGLACSFCCVYWMPAKAEKPTPNRLNARPVAYWLVFSQITRPPKVAAIKAPATAPAPKASQSLPVCTAVAKPAIAATSIIPSAPRLTMPARSLINRPRPAMASTVPAFSVAAISRANDSISGLADLLSGGSDRLHRWCGGHALPAHAVMNQGVAGEQREQQQPLEHAGQRLRQPEARLRELAADLEHAHQHRREDAAHRMQAADEGDDDGRKAVT